MNSDEKERILLKNLYEVIEGYVCDYDRDELQSIIITMKEINEWQKQPPSKWYYHPNDEYVRTLEDAWDCFAEDYMCQNDLDMSEPEFEDYAREKWCGE